LKKKPPLKPKKKTGSARGKEGKPAEQELCSLQSSDGLAQVLGKELGSGFVLLGKVQKN
jgi:hypothetical protein